MAQAPKVPLCTGSSRRMAVWDLSAGASTAARVKSVDNGVKSLSVVSSMCQVHKSAESVGG